MRVAPLLIGLVTAAAVTHAGAQQPGGDRTKLQGTWVVSKVEWPADLSPRAHPPKEALDALTVTVAGDRVTLDPGEKGGPKAFALLKENAGKSPRELDIMAVKGPESREPYVIELLGNRDGKVVVVDSRPVPPWKAIYRFDDDQLVVAVPLAGRVPRPTEFKPAKVTVGDSVEPVMVVTLTRKK
jgi:uncharacterized protein (TIGR03067 family)